MKTPASERISAEKVGWLLVLLTLAWVVLFVVPWPIGKPGVKPPAIKPPPSKLQQVGLRDYTDWEGLPDFFAIWADELEWVDGKIKFAYWNPATRSYTYFFEAIRENGKLRFREISKPKLSVAAEFINNAIEAGCENPTHPFFFFDYAVLGRDGIYLEPPLKTNHIPIEKPPVKVELKPEPLVLPPPVIKSH